MYVMDWNIHKLLILTSFPKLLIPSNFNLLDEAHLDIFYKSCPWKSCYWVIFFFLTTSSLTNTRIKTKMSVNLLVHQKQRKITLNAKNSTLLILQQKYLSFLYIRGQKCASLFDRSPTNTATFKHFSWSEKHYSSFRLNEGAQFFETGFQCTDLAQGKKFLLQMMLNACTWYRQ